MIFRGSPMNKRTIPEPKIIKAAVKRQYSGRNIVEHANAIKAKTIINVWYFSRTFWKATSLRFFVLLYNKTKNRREVAFQNVLEKYQTFIMVLALMALACSTMLRPEYWRFTAALIIFGSGIVLLFMGLPRNIISQLLKNLFLVLTVMCFFIWGYQFSYFNYKKLIVDMMLNSPIIVAIQHLIRL